MKCTRKKMANMYPTTVYILFQFFFFFINFNRIIRQEVFLISIIRRWKFVSNRLASAYTARREEEPIHKDTFAIVIRVVGEQSVPFVFLLAATVAGASIRLGFPGNRKLSRRKLLYSRMKVKRHEKYTYEQTSWWMACSKCCVFTMARIFPALLLAQ